MNKKILKIILGVYVFSNILDLFYCGDLYYFQNKTYKLKIENRITEDLKLSNFKYLEFTRDNESNVNMFNPVKNWIFYSGENFTRCINCIDNGEKLELYYSYNLFLFFKMEYKIYVNYRIINGNLEYSYKINKI